MRAMLLVIDTLNDDLARWPTAERQALVAAADRLGASGIRAGLVYAVAQMRQNVMRITIRGTPGCRIVPELTRRPGDVEIVKKR